MKLRPSGRPWHAARWMEHPVNGRSFVSVPGILGMLITVCKLQAADPSVDWISDSYGSFDVVLSGTGPGWSGTIQSPSGLWQLQSANVIACSAQTPSLAFVDNVGNATFLGKLPPEILAPDPSAAAPFNTASIGTYGGYMDQSSPNTPITGHNSLVYGFLHDLSDCGPFLNWSGMSTISITSIPNPDDISTWTWIAQYTASGQSLESPNLEAPEPSTISFAALAAIFCIARIFWPAKCRS